MNRRKTPNADHHLRRLDTFPNCPDILVTSFCDLEKDEGCAFEELIDFYGGMGGAQNNTIVWYPIEHKVPNGELIDAAHVHQLANGWPTELQGEPVAVTGEA